MNGDAPCHSSAIASRLTATPSNSCSSDNVSSSVALTISSCSKKLEGLALSWEGVGCSYKTTSGKRQVLSDICGKAQAGQLQALIGPSGAGKSTLLDILAARKGSGSVSGSIMLMDGGQALCPSQYKRRLAYVPQEDNFMPMLRPHNALAKLSHVDQRVKEVLELVGLDQHGDTLVGGRLPGGLLLRGLSSGERRRLSIAAAFLATPDVLFLDEPTSGLDSFAALSVMTHLKQLAELGRVVVAAIHQPRSAIWSLFDTVTLLASGLLVYHGPAADMLPWLSGGLGYPYDAAYHGLVSDWALDLVVVEFSKPHALLCSTITTLRQLQAAADTFKHHYHQQQGQNPAYQQLQQMLQVQHGSQQLAKCGVVSTRHGNPIAFQVAAKETCDAGRALSVVIVESAGADSNGAAEQHDSMAVFSRGGSQLDFVMGASGAVHGTSGAASDCASSSGPSNIMPAELQHTTMQEQDQLDLQHDQQNLQRHRVGTSVQGGQPWFLLKSSRPGGGSNCYASWWQQYRALVWREGIKVTRNPADVAGRTLTFAWVALLVGLIYYNMPADASSIRQRLNVLFSTLCFFVLMPFINISIYTEDKGMYLADVAAKLYKPSAYYVAKVTVVLPFHVLSVVCAILIQYGMTGLRPGAESIFKHGAIATLIFLIAAQVLHLAATTMPNQDLAFMMAIGWTCVQMVMSGFFIPYKEMRLQLLANLRFLSAMQYALEGLLQVELGGRLLPCPPADQMSSQGAAFLRQLLPAGAQLLAPGPLQHVLTDTAGAKSCVMDGTAVVAYFGFGRSFGLTMAAMGAYLFGLHLLTFLAMVLMPRKNTR
eukprot:gene6450-6679_t